MTAYISPTSGRTYAVFQDDANQNGTRTYVAVIDLQAVLNSTMRTGHMITGTLPSCVGPLSNGLPPVSGCLVVFIPN